MSLPRRVLTGGAIATAAPPYATQGTVTNVRFVESSVITGDPAALTADWSFPNDPTNPAGFAIDLPTGLADRGDTFTLTAQDSGATIATCVAAVTQVQCDMDESYLAANPVNLRGDVNFWVLMGTETVTTTERVHDFGSNTATVTVDPRPPCTVRRAPCTEHRAPSTEHRAPRTVTSNGATRRTAATTPATTRSTGGRTSPQASRTKRLGRRASQRVHGGLLRQRDIRRHEFA